MCVCKCTALSAPTASDDPLVDGDRTNDAMNREVGDSSGSSSREHADERQDAMPGLLIPGQSRDEHKVKLVPRV